MAHEAIAECVTDVLTTLLQELKKQIRSVNLLFWSTLEALGFELKLKGKSVTVEICVLCGG